MGLDDKTHRTQILVTCKHVGNDLIECHHTTTTLVVADPAEIEKRIAEREASYKKADKAFFDKACADVTDKPAYPAKDVRSQIQNTWLRFCKSRDVKTLLAESAQYDRTVRAKTCRTERGVFDAVYKRVDANTWRTSKVDDAVCGSTLEWSLFHLNDGVSWNWRETRSGSTKPGIACSKPASTTEFRWTDSTPASVDCRYWSFWDL